MFAINMQGKVAVVIGGSRGIGAAVCRALASAGASVAWTHTGSEAGTAASAALETDLTTDCLSAAVDCTDADATDAFVASVVAHWGRLDYLIYNAGATAVTPFLDITPDGWRQIVDANLNGAFIAAHAAMSHLLAARGSAVLVGSAAMATGGGGRADYAAAKAGLEGLCRAITKEFAPQGVRCNVVHPSLVETDLLTQRHPDPVKRAELGAKQVPLGRLGQPQEIADAVVFLLSDRASYITGQALYIDGGRTCCR